MRVFSGRLCHWSKSVAGVCGRARRLSAAVTIGVAAGGAASAVYGAAPAPPPASAAIPDVRGVGMDAAPTPQKLLVGKVDEDAMDARYPLRTKHLSQFPAARPIAHANGSPLSPPPIDRGPGVTYSVSHLLGFNNGGGSVYIYAPGGAPDDIVTFDNVEEATRRDITGTDPLVSESQVDRNPWLKTLTITTRSNDGSDLFPGGYIFQGQPLTDVVYAVGLDRPLLWPGAVRVKAATIQFFRDGQELSPLIPLEPSVFFPTQPWDGEFGIVFPGFAGAGIDRVVLSISMTVRAPGDFDSDYDVDVNDRNVFFQNMVMPTRQTDGDFDANGEVTMRDFQVMQNVCTTGNCSDIYIDEDDSPIIPWLNENNGYINASTYLLDLLVDQIIRILNETGEVARLEIITQRIRQVSIQVLYMRSIQQSVVVVDFLDGRPSMKILYEVSEEYIEVWYQSYEQRVTLIRQVGTIEAESLKQFRTFTKAIGYLGNGIGMASGLITAAQPCLLEQALRDFGEMFDDQPSGLCIPPCLSFFNYLGQIIGWCFGRLEQPLQLGAYYGCIIICDELQYIYTPSEMTQIRAVFFSVAQAIRVRFGC